MYKKIKRKINENGYALILYMFLKKIICKLFTIFILGRFDVSISLNSRLNGINYMKIGKNFTAGNGLWLEAINIECVPKIVIGDYVNIGEYVHIGCVNSIKIGDNVLMGSKIYITDHNHGQYKGRIQDAPDTIPVKRDIVTNGSVSIGDRVWIGEFVTILPGVNIGDGSVIGSHSTVTHDVPSGCIAVGSPARVIKKYNYDLHKWVKI